MNLLAKSIVTLALLAPVVAASEAEFPEDAQRELKRGGGITRGGGSSSRNKKQGGSTITQQFLRSGNTGLKKFKGKNKLNRDKDFKKLNFSALLKRTPAEERAGCAKKKTEKKEAKKKRKAPKAVKKGKKKNRKGEKAPKTNLEIVGGKCVSDHKCAEVRGDPHFKTFDGLSYDCQGQGEFVLAKSMETAFEIQGRFGPPENGKSNAVTITKAISIDTGVAGAPQLDLFAEGVVGVGDAPSTCIINYYVDGVLVEDWGDDGLKYPGLEFFEDVDAGKENMDYAYFTESGLMYSVMVKSGSFGCVLNSKICLPPDMVKDETIFGLLGTPNGDKSDDWMTRNNGDYPVGSSKGSEPFNYCTSQHCVVDAEDSIFGYLAGTSHADYAKCKTPEYDSTSEEMINDATDDCKDCCAPLADKIDAFESCLLECMEGGEEDCVAEIINEEVLAEAQNKCPDSSAPRGPGGKKAPPKPKSSPSPAPTPVCRATGSADKKRMFKKEVVKGGRAVKFNTKGQFTDVKPGTQIVIDRKTYIVTDKCKVDKVDESEDTPSIDTPSIDTPSSESEEDQKIPICKFNRKTKKYSKQMGSAKLKGNDSKPGEEVRVRGGKKAVLSDECVAEPIVESVSSDDPKQPEEEDVPVCKYSGRDSWKMVTVSKSKADKLKGRDALPGATVELRDDGSGILSDKCAVIKDESSEDPKQPEEEDVPVCKYAGKEGWKMAMVSKSKADKLKGKDALPGSSVKVRGGGTGTLSDDCTVIEDESSDDPRQPRCTTDDQCPQPRCQAGFPCFSFTCTDGDCVAKEPPTCSKETRRCDDGTLVSRSGPRCRFAKCPPTAPDSPSPDDRTTKKAFTKGDPHFKTFGGELYDYHGECDLVLLHNPDFKEGLGMDIHIRTKIQDFWSSVESAAIKLGDETMEIRADPSSDEWLWFNGEESTSTLVDGEWYKHEMAGLLVRYKQTGDTREANLYLKGAKEVLVLKTFKSFVRIDVNWEGSDNYFNSNGLLGDHAHGGERLGRNGEFIEDVNAFGQEWQVVPEIDGSLFHSYEGAVVGKQCVMPPSYQPGMNVSSLAEQRRRLGESTLDTEMAEKACNHLVDADEIKACVFDVIATQDLNMASTW